VLGCRLDNQTFGLPLQAGKKISYFFKVSKLALEPTHSTMQLGTKGSPPDVKCQGREADSASSQCQN